MGVPGMAVAALMVLCTLAAAGAAPGRLRGSSSEVRLANETFNTTDNLAEAPAAGELGEEDLGEGSLAALGNTTEVQLPEGAAPEDFAASNASASASAGGAKCMCLFDADRTLTAKQGRAGSCPGDRAVLGVYDDAYGGGALTLSQLGSAGVGATACGGCVTGIVSAGSGGGNGASRARLAGIVRGGPVILGCQGPQKPSCARGLAQRFGVPLNKVYFFDDMASNVFAFSGSGMNAHQVSCSSRDGGGLGLCGAQTWEIQLHSGVGGCR